MGKLAIIATLISAMIGSAIFSISGVTLGQSGNVALYSWIISGLIMTAYGVMVARISENYPSSGGLYYYPKLCLNSSYTGLLSAIGTVLCNIIAVSFSAILIPIFLGINDKFFAPAIVFVVLLFSFFVNLAGLKSRNIFNLFFAMILVVLVLFIAYKVFLNSSKKDIFEAFSFNNPAKNLKDVFTSIPLAMLGFGAICSVAFMAGDVKNPKKSIRQSTIIAGLLVTLLYTIYLVTLVVSGNYHNPLSNYSPNASRIFALIVSVALISTVSVLSNLSAVTLSSIANDGWLPAAFKKKWVTLALTVALCAIISVNNFSFKLINLGAFFSLFTNVVNVLCFAKLYYSNKKKLSVSALIILVVFIASGIVSIVSLKQGAIYSLFFTVAVLLFVNEIISKGQTITKEQDFKLPFYVKGVVEHGLKNGRKVGMPTLNIYPNRKEKRKLMDKCGVFASTVTISGKTYDSLTNIGFRPSVEGDKDFVVETHIISGFSSEVYGKQIKVNIIDFIRPTVKMSSLEEVKKQVDKDKLKAFEIHSRHTNGS